MKKQTDGKCRKSSGNFGSSSQKKDDNALSKNEQYHSLMAMIHRLPEIREKKVLQIKRQIESGTYIIDSRKVAAAMLCEHETECR